jgi:transposase
MPQSNFTTLREQGGQEAEPPIVAELQAIFDTLPDTDLLALLRGPRRRGRPGYAVDILWRCFVTYYALNIESVSALIRYLRNNPYVAAACGIWSPEDMPSQPTFSRFGSRLAKRWQLVAVRNVQRALTQRLYDTLPGFGDVLAIDSTPMKAWSNGGKRGKRRSPVRRQRARVGKVSDPDAAWWVKKNTHGQSQYTWGYKTHLLCDAVYELPIVVDVSAGNLHDVKKATSLLRQVRYAHNKSPKYVLADSAYSSQHVRHVIRDQYLATPIIDPHPTHRLAHKDRDRTPEWRELYKQRTGVERLNSRLKAFYRLDRIRVRGKMKVTLHALLSAVALEARALAFPQTLRQCVRAA